MNDQAFLAFCAGAGVIIAALGLYTWRSQLRGSAEYALVRRLLVVSLRYRDAVRGARTPFSSHDPQEIDPDGSLSREEYRYAVLCADLGRRWNLILSARSTLDAVLIEVEALWGPQCLQVYSELKSIESELYMAYLEKTDAENPNDPEKRNAEDRKRIRYTIYGSGTGDPISERLDATIEEITTAFRPRLRPPLVDWRPWTIAKRRKVARGPSRHR
jgi:hypothetical protein